MPEGSGVRRRRSTPLRQIIYRSFPLDDLDLSWQMDIDRSLIRTIFTYSSFCFRVGAVNNLHDLRACFLGWICIHTTYTDLAQNMVTAV